MRNFEVLPPYRSAIFILPPKPKGLWKLWIDWRYRQIKDFFCNQIDYRELTFWFTAFMYCSLVLTTISVCFWRWLCGSAKFPGSESILIRIVETVGIFSLLAFLVSAVLCVCLIVFRMFIKK